MIKEVTRYMKKLVNLREGAEEKRVMIENIKDDADFSSARFWTLVFAIGVCSVGLNINSIPVVIGAMLMSPLMGPIVSMGMALSIYDWGLMRRSFRNLLILTIISVGISALYFAITPINNAQSELLARTTPTIFDVLIAIFGGMAGFVGLSRARQTTIIPGVAIATALMPPLCTVGYGIATMQANFIFGAFYLFLINCIFICLSALVVSRYLKLPKKEYPDEAKRQQVTRIISAIIFVIVTPAAFFAYTFVSQNNFNQNVEQFISSTFVDKGDVVIYKNIDFTSDPKVVELAFLSERFTIEEIDAMQETLFEFGLTNTKLVVRQDGFALTEEEWQALLADMNTDDQKLLALEAKLEKERLIEVRSDQLLAEIQVLYPTVSDVAYGVIELASGEELTAMHSATIFNAEETVLTASEADEITAWLRVRLGDETFVPQFVPEPLASSTSQQ